MMTTSPTLMRDDRLADFLRVRQRLFRIAYRILNSPVEAEDLVQDVWLRWQRAEHTQVLNPAAFLAVTTTRLAINRARSLSLRRDAHERPAFAEPTDACFEPAVQAERGEELELACQLLMQRLSPRERDAYVLREAFNYPYLHIAGLLGISEVTCRQLVTRARKHLADDKRSSARCMDPGTIQKTDDVSRL
jgi:RNA polymerase sigma-70 factor, ECF subfamily